MTNQALYRKYRPQDFKQVLGQEHITDVLEGTLKRGTISHAYLFFGSRGTGKTTVARIFAGRLGVSANDIIEIDAASNNGVDEMRDLSKEVQIMPFESEYKVYILDEVHMFSKSAFNAFLKTLEEPPRHVIFILATTELDKIPDTIVSRCQVFNFRDPSFDLLTQQSIQIAQSEGYTIDQESAELVAFMGNGSFRDTQSILQKVITYSEDKKLSYEEVARVVGAPPKKLIQDFLKGLVEGDSEALFQIIKEAQTHVLDMTLFIKLLMKAFRQVLLVRYAPEMKQELKAELGASFDWYVSILKETKGIPIDSRTLEVFLEAQTRQKNAFIPTLPLELAVVKLFEKKNMEEGKK